MGSNDLMADRDLIHAATRLSAWAAKTYPVTKAQYPHASESEVIRRMMFADDEIARSPKTSNSINICSQSIEGMCYLIGMVLDPIAREQEPGAEKLSPKQCQYRRSVQFASLIDTALYSRGFPRQSNETKQRILTELGILAGNQAQETSSGGCFIATACYGDFNAPAVMTLRQFRDTRLRNTKMGALFISCYYRCSPPIAKFLTRHPYLSHSLKVLLLEPIVRQIQVRQRKGLR